MRPSRDAAEVAKVSTSIRDSRRKCRTRRSATGRRRASLFASPQQYHLDPIKPHTCKGITTNARPASHFTFTKALASDYWKLPSSRRPIPNPFGASIQPFAHDRMRYYVRNMNNANAVYCLKEPFPVVRRGGIKIHGATEIILDEHHRLRHSMESQCGSIERKVE